MVHLMWVYRGLKGATMPAKVQGTTYADVKQYQEEIEATYGATVKFTFKLDYPFRKAPNRIWHILAEIVCTRGVHANRIYLGECTIGGSRGATSAPGAMINALTKALREADVWERDREEPLPMDRLRHITVLPS